MARALPDAGRFAEDEIIIALGVTIEGEKVVLGFVQSGTEKERVIKDFLNSLMDRGLNIDQGLLCVIPAWRQPGTAVRDCRQGDSGWRELLLYVTCFNLS